MAFFDYNCLRFSSSPTIKIIHMNEWMNEWMNALQILTYFHKSSCFCFGLSRQSPHFLCLKVWYRQEISSPTDKETKHVVNQLPLFLLKSYTHTFFTHTLYFFFFLQNNLDYVDPQIANLLFEAGQSSTNIIYNI